MKARWEDLAARARGLATHLLGRAQLDALARVPDLGALAAALRGAGFLVSDEPGVTPERLELAVRRAAAGRLATLARWAGARNAVLAVVFEDEDRRSLRAILRGAVRGATPEERLAGLVPTPALPERALVELARQPTPGAVAALVTAWGSTYGPVLRAAAAAAQPDLLTLELALARTFAARALQGARAARSRVLLDFMRETIDLENVEAALVLSAADADLDPRTAFVAGGRHVSLAIFLDAVAARGSDDTARKLASAFGPSRLAAALERAARQPAMLEEILLGARRQALRERARRDPASVAAVLAYVLDLRAEVLSLRRIIWGIALGAPSLEIAAGLVAA